MNDQDNSADKPYLRTIRSFVRREGRMTPRQQQALESYWPTLGLEIPHGLIDFEQLFGRSAPVIIEIGFGMGQSLLELAIKNPGINYLGIEVHRPGVGALLADLAEHSVSNVRVMVGDAKEILQTHVPSASLDAVLLFFPDPWPKKRHHKRRLVQPEWINLVADSLKAGGTLHMATDWENYAEHMLIVASHCLELDNVSGAGHFTPRPDTRPLTKFERRGQKLGHGVWDLLFIKRS